MEKGQVKELYGLGDKKHQYDMRPRFDLETYIDVLRIADENGIKPNPLIRAIVKCWLMENKDKLNTEKVSKLLKFISAA